MTRRSLLPLIVFFCFGATTLAPASAGAGPAEDVLLPAASEQLGVVIARKGHLSVDACFVAGDAGAVAGHLGGAPYGCAVTATCKKDKRESFMLRMNDDGDDVLTELYQFA